MTDYNWIMSNGQEATCELGYFNRDSLTFNIQTSNQKYLGVQDTVLRGCSENNELVDIYFSANIKLDPDD